MTLTEGSSRSSKSAMVRWQMCGAWVLKNLFLEDMCGAGECGVYIAVAHRHDGCDVGGQIAVGAGRTMVKSSTAIVHGIQPLEISHNRVGCVLGDIAIVGDDECDRLAHIAHLFAGERTLRAHRRDGRIWHGGRDWLGGEAAWHVARGQHGANARNRQCFRGMDRPDTGVRMRAAQEAAMKHAGQFDVIDKARAAGEERRVFHPRDPCAELLCAHRSCSRECVCARLPQTRRLVLGLARVERQRNPGAASPCRSGSPEFSLALNPGYVCLLRVGGASDFSLSYCIATIGCQGPPWASRPGFLFVSHATRLR